MLRNYLAGRSLRYWIALGMVIALTPLALSAIGGYTLLQRGVMAPFHDVITRQHSEIAPLQELRLELWDSLVPVDEFVDQGGAERAIRYRTLRGRIETNFAALHKNLAGDEEARILLERARDIWTDADALATELFSVERPAGDPLTAEMMDRLHGVVASASDRLGVLNDALAREVEKDRVSAVTAYRRAAWLAGGAGLISLLAVLCGVAIIGRIMSASVDRLVDGAAGFADGDREHRIDVRVPPELRRVADEFNRMIARIRESEAALSELARRDGLTRLLNRRAFDEALAGMYAQMRRTGEAGALITMDIDLFKRVNDTYGHSAGDEVLRVIAGRAASQIRPFDKVYRTGGEEFAVLLLSTDIEVAQDIAARIREHAAAAPIRVGDVDIPVTVSLGVARATPAIEPGELVEAADAALYRAKAGGRNRVVVIDENGMRESAPSDGEALRAARA